MKLRKAIFFICSFFVALNSSAQWVEPGMENPVIWTSSVQKQNDSIYKLIVQAHPSPGWYFYSQEEPGEGGPLPTRFTFNSAESQYELLGPTLEPEGVANYDPVFGMDIKYFKERATFTQTIKIKPGTNPVVEAEVFFRLAIMKNALPLELHVYNLICRNPDQILDFLKPFRI